MKNILCFGDSLTWGFDPDTKRRFPYHERWTGILQKLLGEEYRIIEEGLNGRTTVFNDVFTPYREYGVGLNILPMILDSHAPLDLVVLMLGTNDLQPHRQSNAQEAARGCSKCIIEIMKSISGNGQKAPKILLIAPPAFKTPKGFMGIVFSQDITESQQLAKYYELTANTFGVEFLNAGNYVESCEINGIHLDKEANKILADKIAEKVKNIF